MLPDLNEKLKGYVEGFNAGDEECYIQCIPNERAYEFLKEQIPLVELSDPLLEEIYYFRWWTFRKHWKNTPEGHILTEFLPDVPWAGPRNSINCPVGHHIREGRWMKDPGGWMKEEIRFWLHTGDNLAYSMWFASAVEDDLKAHPDESLMAECYEGLCRWFEKRTQKSLHPCGLYWSEDDRDGMEYSISGPGIRPTLNSYLCADARALARMAKALGKTEEAERYREKSEEIWKKMDDLLWDEDFYRTIPCGPKEPLGDALRPEKNRVRELAGYLPWYFGLPDSGRDGAFSQLLDRDGFLSPFGLSTAERRHSRFLEAHDHECLWNGYVWPFATSQTLTALARVLHEREESVPVSRGDYVRLLRDYAASHRITLEDGTRRPWIDEVLHPDTGRWYSRDILC